MRQFHRVDENTSVENVTECVGLAARRKLVILQSAEPLTENARSGRRPPQVLPSRFGLDSLLRTEHGFRRRGN